MEDGDWGLGVGEEEDAVRPISAVQAPQSPSLQTIFVPISPRRLRRKSDSERNASRPRTSRRTPLM